MGPHREIFCIVLLGLLSFGAAGDRAQLLLEDGFRDLPPGMFSSGVIGAHAEYHYLAETAPKGNWVVSAFKSDGSQRAWRVIEEGGARLLQQTYQSTRSDAYTHPIVIAGDELWDDYTLSVRFAPDAGTGEAGIAFRYRNDRCYYFFGVEPGRAVLKRVDHGKGFRQLDEQVLAEKPFVWEPAKYLDASVTVTADRIRAAFGGSTVLEAVDATWARGKVGLVSDRPARYSRVRVTADAAAFRRFATRAKERAAGLSALEAANPKMVLWRKFGTPEYGAARNVRFGDLDGDGRPDALLGQLRHHGPKDRNSELGCMTAITLEGKILWQSGEADPWKTDLTNDVAFQIHDLDGDGHNEVIYTRGFELVVAEGATGKVLRRIPTPETPKDNKPPHNRFARILGDSLFFCDLRGTGRAGDIILKDRYSYLWAFNQNLELLWQASCNTGHYPFALDIDGDGRDEIVLGYTLFDDDGRKLWSLDGQVQDHADGVAIVRFRPDAELRLLCAASDEGIFFADLKGRILRHHQLGHVQNPTIANLRSDLPGLEAVSINFWGNQGIIHFFDPDGNLYHDFEPVQHGSMMLPVNWTGRDEEYFALSANPVEGGLFDGWGRRVVRFPADGHPDLTYAVLDVTGDCRDELVVWDPWEMWIYTQSDSPKAGRLYKPSRNPMYNYSNYQATVSLPGWSK